MTGSWRFIGFDFYVLWGDTTGESLPWPLTHTNRIPSGFDEFTVLRSEARERLRQHADSPLADALTTLAEPDIWIAAFGQTTSPAGTVSVYAARHGDHGCVVVQETGDTPWDAVCFTITECSAVRLADVVVAALPDAPPGRTSELALAAPDEAEEEPHDYLVRSAVEDDVPDPITDRGRRFLDTTPVCDGTIEIVQGRSIFGPRGMDRHRLQWRDLDDDGRYVIDDRPPPVAIAADATTLVAMVNIRIAEIVRAIREERSTAVRPHQRGHDTA